MASNVDEQLFSCSTCNSELDFTSKTLPCLHSFCGECVKNLEKELKGQKCGQCPECEDSFNIEELTLSSVLVNSLTFQKFESTEWKCDLCSEDNKDSMATNWCQDCAKCFCKDCNRFHQKLPRDKHNSVELAKNGKDEVFKLMKMDLCKIHNKMEDSYCDRCNVCHCDICYTEHLKHSPQCPSRPISVRGEALMKQESKGANLLQEISHFENNLQRKNKEYLESIEKLSRQCVNKCEDIWRNFEKMLEDSREKIHEMCDEIEEITNEQVKKWRKTIKSNEKMLKKLEIWRINLRHLMKKDVNKKTDIVCGVELVGTKLASSSFGQFDPQINKPVGEYEFTVKFSSYYLQFLEELKNQMIGSSSLNCTNKSIEFENQWNLPGSNTNRFIRSITVHPDDSHIFLADWDNKSIIELSESGQLISEFSLTFEGKEFTPREMFFNSSKILVVNCWRVGVWDSYLIFLERKKNFPFLQKNKIIQIKKDIFDPFSVCEMKKTILICDASEFNISFYTEKGDFIKTIDTGESCGRGGSHLIRAEPSTGNFWGSKQESCKIFYFNEKGQKINFFEMEETISDFCLNEFQEIYFCNEKGIFSFFPEKNLILNLDKFPEGSRIYDSKIFVLNEKMFVYLKINGEDIIKIFKFLQ